MNSLYEANNKIKEKYPYLNVLEYNGYYNDALFHDVDYGNFIGNYQSVFSGSKNHPNRVLDYRNESNFKHACEQIKNIGLNLIKYNGSRLNATVEDPEFGIFEGIFNNILLKKKKHPDRILKDRFEHAFCVLKNKYNHYSLIKYTGYNNISIVDDLDFGVFEGVYENILLGVCKHKDRIDKEIQDCFNNKANEIKLRHPYLTLLSIEKNAIGTFLDSEYGVFEGNFHKVCLGTKRHPQRSLANKKLGSQKESTKKKRKNTCIEKYGKTTPLLTLDSVYDFDGLTAKDLYNSANLDISYVTFVRLIKIIGKDKALEARKNKTSLEMIIEGIFQRNNIDYIFNKPIQNLRIRPDFLITSHNLIVEADGLLYHCDKCKRINKNYHQKRQLTFSELGYDSLFFRSDEILNKRNLVESIICRKLGKINNIINANDCEFEYIENITSDIIEWFKYNHINNHVLGGVFCLKFNGKICAACLVKNKHKHVEILRFCNKTDCVVVGGFEKVLERIISNFNSEKIVFTIDSRFEDPKELIDNGFIEKSNKLSYKWTNFYETHNESCYPNNSGYDYGMYKIWDCGQKKFVLNIKK